MKTEERSPHRGMYASGHLNFAGECGEQQLRRDERDCQRRSMFSFQKRRFRVSTGDVELSLEFPQRIGMASEWLAPPILRERHGYVVSPP